MPNPEEFELKDEEGEGNFIQEIINHPVIQDELERYKIFSKAYFEQNLTQKEKDEIKERADEVLKEDPIYKGILENKDFLSSEDFINYVQAELGAEGFKKIREAKKEDLDKVLKEIHIDRQIDRELKERKQKEILAERIGDMWVEVINNECRLHLPRISKDPWATSRGVEESFKSLVNLFSTDEKFKNIEIIDAVSWLFGQKGIARRFDRAFGWHPYTKKEIDVKVKPKEYKETQNVGIVASPPLFEEYLLKGKRPGIGGRWISKDDFIEKMTRGTKPRDLEEIEKAQEKVDKAFEKKTEEEN